MPRKRTRRVYRSYRTPQFGPWKPAKTHEHTLIQVNQRDGANTLIIDICTDPNCDYEAARDLIPPEGDHDGNQN